MNSLIGLIRERECVKLKDEDADYKILFAALTAIQCNCKLGWRMFELSDGLITASQNDLQSEVKNENFTKTCVT